MELSYKKMVQILVDKGHNKEFAERQAVFDLAELVEYECDICRKTMLAVEWRYHYHPCE